MAKPTPLLSYSPSLFPTPMFPSFSQPLPGTTQPKESQEHPPNERDELVEVGAIVALLKVAFG
jgi:hypothetical protein